MSKFKTVSTDSSTHRIFEGQLRVCSADNKKNFKVDLLLLNEKVNRNNWQYTKVAEHANEANDIPLLYSAFNGKIGGSHDFDVVVDEKGNKYASFIGAESEHPYGWLPSIINGESNARMRNIDGIDWLTATAYLPYHYNVEMIKELEKNGGQLPISIETLVSKSHYEGDVEVMDEYSIIGVTILGVDVRPAVANAKIRKLSANGELLQEVKMRCASLVSEFNKEPQTQKENLNLQKGVTKRMSKVRKIDDLRKLFPEFTVLAVKGQSVALLNDKGRCCSYNFQDNENTVIPEKIEEIAVNSVFGEGENAIDVSAEVLLGSVQVQLNSTKAALDKATADNAELTAKINAMAEAERVRRKKAVETAVRDRVRKLKDTSGCDIADNFCDDLLTDEVLNEYANMEDKSGVFCGDVKVIEKVDARGMQVVMDANKAKNNAKETRFVWENGGESASTVEKTGIDAYLSEYDTATRK